MSFAGAGPRRALDGHGGHAWVMAGMAALSEIALEATGVPSHPEIPWSGPASAQEGSVLSHGLERWLEARRRLLAGEDWSPATFGWEQLRRLVWAGHADVFDPRPEARRALMGVQGPWVVGLCIDLAEAFRGGDRNLSSGFRMPPWLALWSADRLASWVHLHRPPGPDRAAAVPTLPMETLIKEVSDETALVAWWSVWRRLGLDANRACPVTGPGVVLRKACIQHRWALAAQMLEDGADPCTGSRNGWHFLSPLFTLAHERSVKGLPDVGTDPAVRALVFAALDRGLPWHGTALNGLSLSNHRTLANSAPLGSWLGPGVVAAWRQARLAQAWGSSGCAAPPASRGAPRL